MTIDEVHKVPTQLEIAFNRVKEIAIYEAARGIFFDRRNDTKEINDYIGAAKECLIGIYPDVNWGTLKYGPDMR